MEGPHENPVMPEPMNSQGSWNAQECADWLETTVSEAENPNQAYADGVDALLKKFPAEKTETTELLGYGKGISPEGNQFYQALVEEMGRRGGADGFTGFQKNIGMTIRGSH